MTMARGELVDSTVTPYYHCISRCVRRAFLCGEGCEHRKQWVEDRLRELDLIFAVECAAYAILDNHMHVVLKLNDEAAAAWSDEDVVRRWGRLFPPRGKDRKPLEVSEAWVAAQLQDAKWVAETRKRLNSLSWFMKCLKEPLARMANKEDGCKGTFFEGRYKSIAILDEEALLTTLAYVDLNLVAAGVAKTPEESEHTSVKARVDHCREHGTLEQVVDQPKDRTKHDKPLEDGDLWLVPIEDRREHGGSRSGVSPHMNLAGYLQLLDWSSRLLRTGKARVPKEVAGILDRLGSRADFWQRRLEKLRDRSRIFGTVFATKRSELNRMAESRGVKKLSNLNGCSG
ncbi:MAG: transposase [Planctomycetaceae bacterium]